MADVVYPYAKSLFLIGEIDLVDNVIKAQPVSADYVYSSGHQFRSALGAHGVGTPVEITGRTISGSGVFDGDDITFTAVTGSEIAAIVLYKDNGSAAADVLVAYLDSCVGLPYTPTGADLELRWDSGPSKIFRLV